MYTPLLLTWARRLGLGPADAADLVQDIFTVLVSKLPTFEYDPCKSFRGWLKTILLNRWRTYQRRDEHRQALDEELQEIAASNLPELEETEHREYLVARALRFMQAEFRDVTWKACWELVVAQRPAAEIAQELGISVNSVYLAKSRVLRRLREELAGLLD